MPKRTNKPSKVRRKRRTGFRARTGTKSGMNIIKRRRKKGRRTLSG